MSENLTVEWLREMINRQMKNHRRKNSMLLESPYGENIEIVNDLPWSQMNSILTGQGEVDMLAIMTPENPVSWKGNDEYNRNEKEGSARRASENASRRRQFEDALEVKGYKIYIIGGSYGVPENSYIIFDMSLDAVIELGDKWGQDSVIHGKKVHDDEMGSTMEYKMLKTSSGGVLDQAAGVRYQIITGPAADKRNDLFSSYNGVKFYIPFYEDPEGSEVEEQPEEEEEVPVEL